MRIEDPFHEGERAVQARTGETGAALLNARMIADTIPQGAWPFLTRQPWAILGGEGAEGRLWCSALVAAPGFASAEDGGGALSLDLAPARIHPSDPLLPALEAGQRLGLLFLEPSTRRRLRVNGRLAEAGPRRLRLAVEEAFPNCPKHIRPRAFESGGSHGLARHGSDLDDAARELIQSADTLFLATSHPARGFDASHRGGEPGFVEVLDGRRLRLPDYAGNSLFQSFGNLEADPRLALLVPDFATGALLHLSGRAHVRYGAQDPEDRSGGTGRFLEMGVEAWRLTPGAAGGF